MKRDLAVILWRIQFGNPREWFPSNYNQSLSWSFVRLCGSWPPHCSPQSADAATPLSESVLAY